MRWRWSGLRSTCAIRPALQCQRVTHSHSFKSRTQATVPAGWDNSGENAALQDGFDTRACSEAWERNLSHNLGIDFDGEPGARKLSTSFKQDKGSKYARAPPRLLNSPTPEQVFLARNYDENAWRTDRNPRRIFLTPTDPSAPPAAGRARTGEDGRPGSGAKLGSLRRAGAPASLSFWATPSPRQHEVLQNFFKCLLNPKDHAASSGSSVVRPGAAAWKLAVTGR